MRCAPQMQGTSSAPQSTASPAHHRPHSECAGSCTLTTWRAAVDRSAADRTAAKPEIRAHTPTFSKELYMPSQPLGIIVNGATGRMGYRQHLVRSLLAIREEGGVE